jgi:hypothetical protein
MRPPTPATGWRKPLQAFGNGLMFVLRPLQIVFTFVFLALAYFLGVGLSALLYRLGPGRKKALEESPQNAATYWGELPPAPTDRESWLRPF